MRPKPFPAFRISKGPEFAPHSSSGEFAAGIGDSGIQAPELVKSLLGSRLLKGRRGWSAAATSMRFAA